MSSPTFIASGLASGMDTSTIISKLVQLESQPITALQTQQQAYSTQVSTLGDLSSKLAALKTAVQALGQDGAVGVSAQTQNTSFTATPGSTAAAGSYSVQVTATAKVGKLRSAGFASTDAVAGGTLHLVVQDKTYDISLTDGTDLATVASAIRDSGAPVTASVLSTGTQSYLSITAQDSGYPLGTSAARGLSVTQDVSAGSTHKALAFGSVQAADNAVFSVDGLSFTRTSNLVTDAIPGVSFALRTAGAAEDLTLSVDASATKDKLQTFVDAYNAVMSVIQQQLNPGAKSNRTTSLAGDPAVRGLEGALQSMMSQVVPGLGTVQSLADLGIKSAQDGTLSIDETTLSAALARAPSAVNDVFSQATTGISDVVSAMVDSYVDPLNGILTGDQNAINDRISDLKQRQADLQARVDAYQASLQARFAAMESLISKLKASSTYLTTLSNTSSSSGTSSSG